MSSSTITVFGVIALTFMMVMYALERRHPSLCSPLHWDASCQARTASCLGLGRSAQWNWSGQEWLPDVTWELKRSGQRIRKRRGRQPRSSSHDAESQSCGMA